jgi:AraC family transcriptional activator of pobA
MTCPEAKLTQALQELIAANYKFQRGQQFYNDALNVTYYYLNGVSKRRLGKTVYQLVADCLLKESKALLSTTACSVKTIAYELGFSDPSNFVKFFKGCTGQTPLEFRQQVVKPSLT